ncbi:MAG TPA: HK97 family phage prohead protease [Terriglobales bacterium]|nr:HK97 family phage prohead protease [Terriglobales bacterium]
MRNLEKRTITGMFVRSASDEKFELQGVAAAYMTPSSDLGGFTEMVMPGAFTRSLRDGADVKCLVNHDASRVLGRVQNGTLALNDTPEGLRFTVKLDRNNTEHKNIYSAVRRGDVNECSFAFRAPKDGKGERWDTRDGKQLRYLKDVDLFDVSIVTYPAYGKGTSVSARSADYRLSTRDVDAFHRAEARRLEFEILRNAPGYWIDEKKLTVRAMTQAEADARADERNRQRARELEAEVRKGREEAERRVAEAWAMEREWQ